MTDLDPHLLQHVCDTGRTDAARRRGEGGEWTLCGFMIDWTYNPPADAPTCTECERLDV